MGCFYLTLMTMQTEKEAKERRKYNVELSEKIVQRSINIMIRVAIRIKVVQIIIMIAQVVCDISGLMKIMEMLLQPSTLEKFA